MEQDILTLVQLGKRDAALEALLDLYQNKVYRLMLSMTRNSARAEELTQDVFFKVWQALPGYDGRASFSTWIYTIARNTALTHIRSESYRFALPLDAVAEPAATPASRVHPDLVRNVAK